jgi:PAS domain S-box-containing protein
MRKPRKKAKSTPSKAKSRKPAKRKPATARPGRKPASASRNGMGEWWENQMRTLADSIPDHVYFKDREGRFLWVNRNMLKVRGLSTPEELIGKTDFDIHARERAQLSWNDERAILDTGNPVVNKLETDSYADGSLMWVLTTKIPMRDARGRIAGICGISKDVTAQVEGERALARENFLRNEFLESIPDSVYFKDRDSRFTWINQATADQLGLGNKEEVLGKTDFDFFTEDHAREARADEVRAMEAGISLVNKLELDNYADGSPRWVYSTKIPLHDGDGKVFVNCGFTKDVT